MNLGVRGHDVPSESAELLCQKLCQLGLYEIQLVAHKSFPDFPYGKETVTKLAETLKHYGIRVAIYDAYTPKRIFEEAYSMRTHLHTVTPPQQLKQRALCFPA